MYQKFFTNTIENKFIKQATIEEQKEELGLSKNRILKLIV